LRCAKFYRVKISTETDALKATRRLTHFRQRHGCVS
jgi:hypothetical protein